MRKTGLLIWAFLTLTTTDGLAASEPNVDEIVQRTNKTVYYQGKDGRAQVTMTITDRQGRQRERRFVILRSDTSDTDEIEGNAYYSDQQFYLFFQRPADVNKMAFLVWKHLNRDDDRWLYLPALDLVKRIAASDQRTSFVGSDYFYEDVSGRDMQADEHELTETTDTYYVLKHTPRDPKSVEFSHYVMYVHKTTFIPVQTEYYDTSGEKYRVATVLKVDTIDGYPTVTSSSMEDLRSGSKTVMSYRAVGYNVGLPEDIFSERHLRKPPVKFLR
jgi:hypothetical protein